MFIHKFGLVFFFFQPSFCMLSFCNPQPHSCIFWKPFNSHQMADYPLNCHYWTKIFLPSSFNYGFIHRYVKWGKETKTPKGSVYQSDGQNMILRIRYLYFCSVLIAKITRLPTNAFKKSWNCCRAPMVQGKHSLYIFYMCLHNVSSNYCKE